MFLTNRYNGYNRHGEQSAGGYFLIAASSSEDVILNPRYRDANGKQISTPNLERIYVAVRYVRMVQFGHFMMGSAQVGDTRLTLSGSYGHDGLPLDLSKLSASAKSQFTPLSDEETIAFWHPEHPGWNSTGSEASMMRRIGLALLKERKRAS